MENTLQATNGELREQLYGLTGRPGVRMPRPPTIRLNGKTGEYEVSEYDAATKTSTKKTLANAFVGTILFVRSQVTWKFQEGSEVFVRSDEFDSSQDTVTLWKFTKGHKEALFRGTYSEIKEKYVQIDPATGQEKYPFDYRVVLYLDHQDQVYRMDMKGTSRGNWFDFMESRRKAPEHLAELEIIFGTREDAMKSGTKYFSSTFTVKGASALGTRALDKIRELKEFFNLFVEAEHKEPEHVDAQKGIPESIAWAQNTSADPNAEIRVEDIPF